MRTVSSQSFRGHRALAQRLVDLFEDDVDRIEIAVQQASECGGCGQDVGRLG